MSESNQNLQAKRVSSNGHKPDFPKRHSPVRDRSFGRLYEILAVAALTACIFVYPLGIEDWWGVLAISFLLALCLLAYKRAISRAERVEEAEEAIASEKRTALAVETERSAEFMYQVTHARLQTLKASGVPEDVTLALAILRQPSGWPAQRLLRELALDPNFGIGWDRTNEFSEKILKYTKVDRDMAPTPADVKQVSTTA